MAHYVTFDLPTRELGKADVRFTIKQDGEEFGELEVSRGAIVWYPKGLQYGHKLSWSDLNRASQKYPRVELRKRRKTN
jgi:hypothetical protein